MVCPTSREAEGNRRGCGQALRACCLTALLVCVTGCYQEIRRTSVWDDFPGAKSGSEIDADTPRGGTWAIALASFEGPDRYQQSFNLVRELQAEANLPDLWYDDNGQTSTVYAGRFRSPRQADATSTMERVRQATLDGEQPFADAEFRDVGAVRVDAEALDPLDLRRHAGAYTLQIGFYDREFGERFREAAEEAARTLRDDGHEAFFYHGPNRSLVTVGLFTNSDFVMVQGRQSYGPRIKEVQQTFPHHFANGLEQLITRPGQPTRKQETLVVQAR